MKKPSIVLGSFAARSLSGAVLGDFVFFTDPGEFFAALEAQGKISKGFWDFTPDLVGPGFVGLLADPLNHITAPGTGFWDSMPLDNIQFQSNKDPQGGNGPNPGNGMVFVTPPGGPWDNSVLLTDLIFDSFDILSGVPEDDNHTAMAIQVVGGEAPILVTVWDNNEQHKTTIQLYPRAASNSSGF